MIDPTKITNYNRTTHELQELLLFCIAVAGKNATTTAKNLEKLLSYCYRMSQNKEPFAAVRYVHDNFDLPTQMRIYGFGCWKLKSRGIAAAAASDLDLRTCSIEDLEALPGVGQKTARFFILHSRRNAKVACLDTHILKWMAYFTGFPNVPTQSPSSRSQYLLWEKVFLEIAEAMKTSPADLDLKIWNKQRGTDEESLAKAS